MTIILSIFLRVLINKKHKLNLGELYVQYPVAGLDFKNCYEYSDDINFLKD